MVEWTANHVRIHFKQVDVCKGGRRFNSLIRVRVYTYRVWSKVCILISGVHVLGVRYTKHSQDEIKTTGLKIFTNVCVCVHAYYISVQGCVNIC